MTTDEQIKALQAERDAYRAALEAIETVYIGIAEHTRDTATKMYHIADRVLGEYAGVDAGRHRGEVTAPASGWAEEARVRLGY